MNIEKQYDVIVVGAQADRVLYRKAIRQALQNTPNLTLFQQAVDDLIVDGDKITGVVTQLGLTLRARAVILTAGTFLSGKVHVGLTQYTAGRAGDPAAVALSHRLRELNLPVGRLKTGTPPRIDRNSIDFSVMSIQPGDTPVPVFSYMGNLKQHPRQLPCHITHTTLKTKTIIQENLHLSPMYSGVIEGIGPRYCPSIEDKIVRFSEKDTHQIFVEPEGLTSTEIYPNGISTSLPFEVQIQIVQSITGFEKAHITRPGYAIEYDYFDPRALTPYLQTKAFSNLFFAGQINGTTGYEEAAAQGLIAGLNAACLIQDKPFWSPKRDEAYIGVLIDDLITLGTQEPYRMFTSRAEYRLMLREDNADARLTEIGRNLGLVSEQRWIAYQHKQNEIAKIDAALKATIIRVNDNPILSNVLSTPLSHDCHAMDLIKRPEVNYQKIQAIPGFNLPDTAPEIAEQIDIRYKYQGYIDRQQQDIAKLKKQENTQLPDSIDYSKVSGLSNEVVQKLTNIKPRTLGQAGRISGVTPAALSLLMVHLKKQQKMA
jgi:tRNA uridine 5-carboxymethylaminomethyl modification enzyme